MKFLLTVGNRLLPPPGFCQQPDSRLLGPSLGARPSRNDLDQIEPTPCDRVDTGIDPHTQRAARKLVDAPALPPLPTRCYPWHDASIA